MPLSWKRGSLEPWILWAIASAALVLRVPRLFLEPRLCFDEGTAFFMAGRSLPFWDSLFLVYGDYLALWANLGGSLAGLLPLSVAVYGPFAIGLLCQLAPIWVAIHGRGPQFGNLYRRFFFLVFATGLAATPYMWATTFGAQYHLALAAALLLLEEPVSGRAAQIWRAGLLFAAGLSGLVACVLIPLFALRFLMQRTRSHFIGFAAICAAGLIQLAIIATAAKSGGDVSMGDRFSGLTLELFPAIFAARVGLLFFVTEAMRESIGLDWFRALGAVWPTVIGCGIALFAAVCAGRSRLGWLFFGGLLLTFAFGVVGSLDVKRELLLSHVGDRYFLSARLLLFALLLQCAWGARPLILRVLASLLLSVGLFNAIASYANPEDLHFAEVKPHAVQAQEIAAGERRFLQIWPPGFFIDPTARFGTSLVEGLPEGPEGPAAVRIEVDPLVPERPCRIRISGPKGAVGVLHCLVGPITEPWVSYDANRPPFFVYIPVEQIKEPSDRRGLWEHFVLDERGEVTLSFLPPRLAFGGYLTVQAAVFKPQLAASNAVLLRAGFVPAEVR